MNQSIFTALIDASIAEACSKYGERLNSPEVNQSILQNPDIFSETMSFGFTAEFIRCVMDCTLQKYHEFLCEALKTKGVVISNLDDFMQ